MSDLQDLREVESADVYKKGRLAARLERRAEGVIFRYLPEYLSDPGPAVATTLPISGEEVLKSAGAVPPYFAGLLPEGARLTSMISRLKTSADDELSLLLAVGADTIGDVQVIPTGTPLSDPQPRLKVADNWNTQDFRELFRSSVQIEDSGWERVGLPGVQPKVSAEMISFPISTGHHILKLSPPEYPRLAENEAFFLRLAQDCGIRIPEVELVHDKRGESGVLVRRFDRAANGVRLAQEDACQLLGRYPADKYRVSMEQVAGAVKDTSGAPIPDILNLVSIAVFCFLIGNGDLHAKNVSMGELLGQDRLRLTPTYDLISTIAYLPDDQQALPISGRRARLTTRNYVDFSQRYQVSERATRRSIQRICDVVELGIKELSEVGFSDDVEARLTAEVRNRIASLRQGLIVDKSSASS